MPIWLFKRSLTASKLKLLALCLQQPGLFPERLHFPAALPPPAAPRDPRPRSRRFRPTRPLRSPGGAPRARPRPAPPGTSPCRRSSTSTRRGPRKCLSPPRAQDAERTINDLCATRRGLRKLMGPPLAEPPREKLLRKSTAYLPYAGDSQIAAVHRASWRAL